MTTNENQSGESGAKVCLRNQRRRARRLAGVLLSMSLAAPVLAGSDDHDMALQALQSKQIMSLKQVLDKIERDYPGRVMEVELERKHERWIYEVKLLRQGGMLTKMKIDARDGAVLESKERN